MIALVLVVAGCGDDNVIHSRAIAQPNASFTCAYDC